MHLKYFKKHLKTMVLFLLLGLNNISYSYHFIGDQTWSILIGGGYSWYESAYHGGFGYPYYSRYSIDDGQTLFGRLALAKQIWLQDNLQFGIESGIQSGNTFRVALSSAQMEQVGGLLPQSTIKPLLDFLGTMYYQSSNKPLFGVLKLGVAWRRMQINDRISFNDLSQAAFDAQLGVGVNLSKQTNISINYQTIFSGTTVYSIDTQNYSGHISNILPQNSLLINISHTL